MLQNHKKMASATQALAQVTPAQLEQSLKKNELASLGAQTKKGGNDSNTNNTSKKNQTLTE